MGRTALVAEDRDALNETIALIDKSEDGERKQIKVSICILVTLHGPMCA